MRETEAQLAAATVPSRLNARPPLTTGDSAGAPLGVKGPDRTMPDMVVQGLGEFSYPTGL